MSLTPPVSPGPSQEKNLSVESALGPVSTGFEPPRHWRGVEELSEQYWNDPQVQERRAQEFYDKPVESIALIDKLDTKGIARRDFLTIMGAGMAMASFSCARRPVHKIIPYVVQPEEVTPGVANFYASLCPETGEGILVKVREGRPIKLEGNPDYPVNRGALSARTQASLLELYDPERLKEPMKRAGAATQTLSWADADAQVLEVLKKAGKVRLLTAPVKGDSTRRLISEVLAALPGAGHVEYDALALDEIADAQADCYGASVVPHYRFDLADVVVSIGADFLGAWPTSTAHMADWAKRRRLQGQDAKKAQLSKVFAFESMMTVTGANADERFPVRPGDELKVALALAHEILVVKKAGKLAGDASIAQALQGYGVEAVASDLHLHGGAETLRKVAKALLESRGKGIVVAGSVQAKSRDALALQVAVNLLNSALENEGAMVEGNTGMSQSRPAPGLGGLAKLVAEMKAGTVDALIIQGVNPVYTAPGALGFAEALKKVPFVVVIGTQADETAALAHSVLPEHHYLESWGDAEPRKGFRALQQPAIAPIHSTRAFQDTLLSWVRGGIKASGLAGKVAAAEADSQSWYDYLKAHWQETVYKSAGASGSFIQFWEGVLREGVLLNQAALSARGTPRAFRTGAVSAFPRFRAASSEVVLGLYAKSSLYDGKSANNAWLQEFPDPITTMTWDNYVNIGPGLAKQLKLQTHDVVEVKTGDRTFKLPVNVQPGMHPGAAAIAVGYGRTSAGKVGNGVGTDVYPLAGMENGRAVFAGFPVKLTKTGARYRLAETQWHHSAENRPIINDITLAEYRANPGVSNHTDPHLRMEEVPTMWPKFEYKGYKWGMAIDLSTCTGCGACVVACQAENNIPTVGRDNVRISREMHWIRIDRYYSGSEEAPNVVFQPMLCQHCDNAPCETVCPVLATVHNDEGMNVQVYNRCVGTRYCMNNCPYKTRRFNFFDHWKSYEGTQNLVWNPDVTVRSRGIMEKCTFCVQRVREAKDRAKDTGAKVRDGDLKTACQQTCPTEAIVFGDINNPDSQVAKLQKDKRAFRVLEVLNTKPVISYMTKVRNQEAQAHSGHGGGDHGQGSDGHHGKKDKPEAHAPQGHA
jgi:MoCo/4Fe-4S cofactor protein with predicted Tat translocation signal